MSEVPTPARIEPQTSIGNRSQLGDKPNLLERLERLTQLAEVLDLRMSTLEEDQG